MIVVDSSVWIAALRGPPTAQVFLLREVVRTDDVVVGDIVLAEVLQGARDETHASRIEQDLRQYAVMPMVGADAAARAARHYRTLRGAGVTVRRMADLLIGTFCLDHGWTLLHADRDFDAMERVLGLMVLR